MYVTYNIKILGITWSKTKDGNWKPTKTKGMFVAHKNFYKDFKLKKSRSEFICRNCSNKFNKGVMYVGSRSSIKEDSQMCFVCAEKVLGEIMVDMDKMKNHFKEIKKQYTKKNITKWNKEALVSVLE